MKLCILSERQRQRWRRFCLCSQSLCVLQRRSSCVVVFVLRVRLLTMPLLVHIALLCELLEWALHLDVPVVPKSSRMSFGLDLSLLSLQQRRLGAGVRGLARVMCGERRVVAL